MKEWQNLFVAASGSAAALAGLVFVAVSINLNRILSLSRLADRALVSLVLLLSILIVSILSLVPDQSKAALGAEIIALFALLWIGVTRADIAIYRHTSAPYKKQYRAHLVFNQLAILPYLVAGILFLNDGTGAAWIVSAFCFCFVKAFWDAWILLVEINR